MVFEVGKFYRHTCGKVLHILAEVDNCTGFFNPCLIGEEPGYTAFLPIGATEDHAENWEEIPSYLYYSEWLRGNEDSAKLRKLATPPGASEPILPLTASITEENTP